MSVAEFLDGMPSFDERNFSLIESNKRRSKRLPVYISTEDKPCDQIIVPDKSHLLLPYLHKKWDKKILNTTISEEFDEILEETEQAKKTYDFSNLSRIRKILRKIESSTLNL